MTREEYWELPEGAPRCELINGEVVVVPAPDEWHQEVSSALNDNLRQYVLENGLGRVFFAPVALTLPDETELQPDLVVLQAGHPDLGTRFKSITHPPLLVIEVLSRSTRVRDRKVKSELYALAGIPHYWMADPDRRTIEAWSLVDGVYETSGFAIAPSTAAFQPFPDLTLDLDAIFPKA